MFQPVHRTVQGSAGTAIVGRRGSRRRLPGIPSRSDRRFGVDFSYMSPSVQSCHICGTTNPFYVISLAIISPILGLDHAEVINDDSTAVLDTLGRVSMIFLDPARRDDHGSRTYAIADCTPDVLDPEGYAGWPRHRRSWSSSPPCSTGIRPSPISPARYMRCISSPPGMSARNCCWCWGAAVTPHRSWYVLMTSRCCRTRPAITATITPLSAILPWLHAILAIPKTPRLRSANDFDSSHWKYLYEPNASIMRRML